MAHQIRIKLEKFVSGPEQRIFKTKSNFLDKIELKKLNRYLNFYFNEREFLSGKHVGIDLIPLDRKLDFPFDSLYQKVYDQYTFLGRNDIFWGEFNSEKLKLASSKKEKLMSGDLINLHDININYLAENPNKNQNLYINRGCQSLVSNSSRNSCFKYR